MRYETYARHLRWKTQNETKTKTLKLLSNRSSSQLTSPKWQSGECNDVWIKVNTTSIPYGLTLHARGGSHSRVIAFYWNSPRVESYISTSGIWLQLHNRIGKIQLVPLIQIEIRFIGQLRTSELRSVSCFKLKKIPLARYRAAARHAN